MAPKEDEIEKKRLNFFHEIRRGLNEEEGKK